MDICTFISNIVEHLVWPTVVTIGLFIFNDPISAVIRSLRRIKFKGVEIELEEAHITDDENVNLIISYLARGAHSFQWFRDNTEFKYTNNDFQKIIVQNPRIFKAIKIVKRDEEGKKLPSSSGLPGIKLTSEARNMLEGYD
ncbi:MAG: hypothetical protein HQ580_00115 [Planctomycetes bacterium]|nr:hypothetical protein [Planctomycetota bacterium]